MPKSPGNSKGEEQVENNSSCSNTDDFIAFLLSLFHVKPGKAPAFHCCEEAKGRRSNPRRSYYFFKSKWRAHPTRHV